jgi:hypothetical protein
MTFPPVLLYGSPFSIALLPFQDRKKNVTSVINVTGWRNLQLKRQDGL